MTIHVATGLESSLVIRWSHNGEVVEKRYEQPAKGIVLRDRNAVLLIEPTGHPDNAVIYDADGSEKKRIRNPLGANGAHGFTDCGYEGDELTLTIRLSNSEYTYVVNEAGVARSLREIR